jgi:[protein-PII] uridylyltransferase
MQVLVYAQDKPFLFAKICNFFARMSYNIMEAKILTTQHGYALDSFLVMDAYDDKTEYRDVMNYIEYELTQHVSSNEISKATQGGRINRQLRHFPIAPKIDINQDEKGQFILSVIAGDRPGLLARIAHLLAQNEIELHSAKINTLGARAEDTFRISGKSLAQKKVAENLCEDLRQLLA